MTKTILIALALIAGILAFMYLNPARHEPSPPKQELLGMGQFVVEQDGNKIVTEDYTLVHTRKEGYILISQARLRQGDEEITLAQQYQLTPKFSLSFYQLGIDTQSASRIVSAQPRGNDLYVEVRADDQVRARDIPDRTDTFILDNNLVSQYQLLVLAVETENLDRDFTAVVPQALLSIPAHLDGPNRVVFSSGGEEYDGKRYTLTLGDVTITIVTYKGWLAGLFNPAQGTTAYNATLFPDGVSPIPSKEGAASASRGGEEGATVIGDGSAVSGALSGLHANVRGRLSRAGAGWWQDRAGV